MRRLVVPARLAFALVALAGVTAAAEETGNSHAEPKAAAAEHEAKPAETPASATQPAARPATPAPEPASAPEHKAGHDDAANPAHADAEPSHDAAVEPKPAETKSTETKPSEAQPNAPAPTEHAAEPAQPAKTEDAHPAEPKADDGSHAEAKPAAPEPVDHTPESGAPAEAKPAESEPAEHKAEAHTETKPGEAAAAEPASTAKPSTSSGPAARQPFEWVRTLEAVQEQIGKGSKSAHAYLPKLMVQIADAIEVTDIAVLVEPRNVRAVLAYVLSGGDGKSARRLLGAAEGTLTPLDEKIAKGALAYAEGKNSKAAEYLGDIDARKLDPSLGGRIALVQAILAYKSDMKRALALLDLTRLLASGTLVEEAALRRQVVLEAASQEHDRFESLASQYFRRYSASVYSDNFKQQFAMAAAGLDFSSNRARLERLEAIIDLLKEEEQPELYIQIAEKAIFLGNLALTEFASSKGAALTSPQSLSHARSQLYGASAGIAGDNPDQALTQLNGIDPVKLGATDAGLLRAALAVAREVVRTPDVDETEAKTQAPGEPHEGEQSGTVPEDGAEAGGTEPPAEPPAEPAEEPAMANARQVMAKADVLLKEKRK